MVTAKQSVKSKKAKVKVLDLNPAKEKINGTKTANGDIKVTFWEKKTYLCEIGQTVGMDYAFLSADHKQCHEWVKCRDFLNDALRGQLNKKAESIYGFSFSAKENPPMCLDKMYLLVKYKDATNTSENTKAVLNSALDIIHCIEKHGGIKPLSKLHKVSDLDHAYIFEGASDWVESTFMISLYTLLIRLGAKKIGFKDKEELDSKLEKLCTNGSSGDNDITYLKTVRAFIHKIVEKRKELQYESKKIFADKYLDTFHNYSGIVALCKEANNRKKKRKADVGMEELHELSAHIV
jgi:hypothetical protein